MLVSPQEALRLFYCLLALKLSREIERRLQAAFGTAGADPRAVTLPAR